MEKGCSDAKRRQKNIISDFFRYITVNCFSGFTSFDAAFPGQSINKSVRVIVICF